MIPRARTGGVYAAILSVTALSSACGDATGVADTQATDESGSTETETTTIPSDPYDCADLPDPKIHQLAGPIAAADVAFDDQGNLIGSNTQDLFKASSADGQPALWVPSVSSRAAVRQLSDGRLAVVQEMFFRVLAFTPDGSSEILASNLIYPFGLVEDLEGNIFIADQSRIMRVDKDSGDVEIWLETPDFISRWLSFDREYDGLFVGGRTNTIYRVPIDTSGEAGVGVAWGTLPVPDSPGPAPEPPDTGTDTTDTGTDTTDTGGETGGGEPEFLIDGLGVDACANLYIAEFHSRSLYKIPAGGGAGELLVGWIDIEYGHGLQWGSGMGDWSDTSLFLPQPYNDYNVIEVDIGVPSK